MITMFDTKTQELRWNATYNDYSAPPYDEKQDYSMSPKRTLPRVGKHRQANQNLIIFDWLHTPLLNNVIHKHTDTRILISLVSLSRDGSSCI